MSKRSTYCGMEKMVSRRAHNSKAVGSSPTSATSIFTYLHVFMLVMVVGCKSRPITTHVVKETKVTYEEAQDTVKGSTVNAILDSNSYERILATLKDRPSDTIRIKSEGDKVELKYYLNDSGVLTAECESIDQFIDYLITTIENMETKTETVEKIVKKVPSWTFLVWGVLLTITIISLIKGFTNII